VDVIVSVITGARPVRQYRHVQNSVGAGSYSNNQFLYISVITLNATRIYMKKEMKGIQGHTFYQV
jgi:hypothetical protein